MNKIHFMLISAILSVFIFNSCWQESDIEKPISDILSELSEGNDNDQGEDDGTDILSELSEGNDNDQGEDDETDILSELSEGNDNDQGEDDGNGKKPPIVVLPETDSENDDGENNDSNLTWVQIAEATSAEVTKADANFFCNLGNDEIIVDSNKGKKSGTYYVLEDGKIYEFRRLSSGVYYKGVVQGGWLPSDTVGEYVAAFSSGIYSVVLETLSYLQNIKDLGDGKFSYHRNGMGPDPDIYIFTVTDGLITEMESTVYGGSGILMYRTSVRTYTYGGQTVTLPSEFILAVKLATPENLNIINGIITWDEVEGAYCYTVFIYKNGVLMRDIRRYSADFNFDSHIRTYFNNWESGAYQIKITAVDPLVNKLYESDPATIEYIYQK